MSETPRPARPRMPFAVIFGVAATILLSVAPAEAAFGPIGADFRISAAGTDGDAARDALASQVAYNSAADEYLVVWTADGLGTDEEVEVFGQRVSSAGTELGDDFRISTTGADGDATRDGFNPAVAYNPAVNEYLVVWTSDGLATANEQEIFGQRVGADGTEIGTDFRISNTGTDGDSNRDAFNPAIAYGSAANEYLVVWASDGLTVDNEQEIFGQWISAAGTEVGTDFRISNMGTDGDDTRDAGDPNVAYNTRANEFLVTWDGDGLAVDEEFEIFGQRVSATGAELGADFRISNIGTDGDVTRQVFLSSIAYSPAANEYLVGWESDTPATDEEFEVFAQRVGADGAELGSDFQISTTGADGDADRDGFTPAIAYSTVANEYLVAWEADGLTTDGENEIFGQRLSVAGAELGGDFRISTIGQDDDADRDAFGAAAAFNPLANEYLVTFQADGIADGEQEIFGHRIEGEPAPPPPPPVDNVFSIGKLKGKRLSLTVPGPGVIDVSDAKASKRKLLLKHSSATASAAGSVTVKLKLTKTAKRKLKQQGKVKVKAAITFTPSGGSANTQAKRLKVK